MNIAVYSGSFNPLHIGHLAIMAYLTREAGFDQVYLVVSPQSPFKDASCVQSARQRYEAAVAAVKRHPGLRVRVDDIELGMEPPHYTIRTLDALKAREPENDFTLVIGADNLAVFDRWRDSGRILTEYGLAVFPRVGCHRGHDRARLLKACPGGRIRLLKAPRIDISSSSIRAAQADGRDMSSWLM